VELGEKAGRITASRHPPRASRGLALVERSPPSTCSVRPHAVIALICALISSAHGCAHQHGRARRAVKCQLRPPLSRRDSRVGGRVEGARTEIATCRSPHSTSRCDIAGPPSLPRADGTLSQSTCSCDACMDRALPAQGVRQQMHSTSIFICIRRVAVQTRRTNATVSWRCFS
jgi:hypothetical protein